MVRKDQMRRLTDEEVLAHPNAERSQLGYLAHQAHRIHHHTVPDHTSLAAAQYPGGNKMQHILLAPDQDRVPGVVAAGAADHDISFLGEDVDDLAFAFITPLGAYEDGCGHIELQVRREKAPNGGVGAAASI